MEALKPLTVAQRRPRLVERLGLDRMDAVLLAAAAGLIGFSLVVLGTGAGEGAAPGSIVVRQALYAVAGIALMLAVARVDYTRFRGLRVSVYAAMVGSSALVLLWGAAVRGSQRWIELPLFTFQPSELAKVLLCVSLAAFAVEELRRPPSIRQTLRLVGLALAPAALVLLQPDLGTGIELAVVGLTILFVGGIPLRHLAAIVAAAVLLAGAGIAAGSALGIAPLHGYQQDRLASFLHPSDDPSDSGYQVNQAKIAVGSGEALGRGDDATQTELLFVPERHTDFIFAVIGERFGFGGAMLLIGLFATVLWRSFSILRGAASFYGTLIAAGIVAMLGFQLIVNVGMSLGVMPVTGLTLPLVSYGGSSLLATMLALGLLQSIRVHARETRGR